MEHFRNDGYGWTCKRCDDEQNGRAAEGPRARFFNEGEAETRDTELSTPALARWRDEAKTILYCPRCGVEEQVSNQPL